MNTNIVNASPMNIGRGIQDLSTRTPAVEPEALPTHLVKAYIFAQKGPTSPQLVSGAARDRMYGSATFDLRSKFAKHPTVMCNAVNAQGNMMMLERVLPTDIGPRANLTLWLDLLATDLPNYQRNADGTIKKDALTGEKLVVVGKPTIPGFKGKWVVTRVTSRPADGEEPFADHSPVRGDLGTAGAESTRYPILSLQASSYGEVFNDVGIRLWAPSAKSLQVVNTKSIVANSVYPFRIAVVKRANAKKTATLVATEGGDPSVEFTFKPGVINTLTDAKYTLSDIFLDSYRSIRDLRFPAKYGDFGRIRVYDAYVQEVLGKIYEAEVEADSVSAELRDGDFWMVNPISGCYSSGEEYHTLQLDSLSTNALTLGESYNVFAGGATDGTLSDEMFDSLVGERLQEYADPNSQLMNTAVMAESIFYDTGFSAETKKIACKFISERKDTAVILSTYQVGGQELTAAEEHSLAVMLRTHAQMYPESDYFGTNTVRALIMGRYGYLRDSQWSKKMPVAIELAVMAAKMMGAADGRWKEAATFDRRPNNELTMFDAATINVTYTSPEARNKDWDVGLNFVANATRQTLYFPALKTVYDNDTSVLTSFFNMMACVEIQKVGDRVHRMYSGNVRLSDEQLVQRVNDEFLKMTNGRFAGLCRVVPKAQLTDADMLRGFSWSLPVEAYFNNMKTVQVMDIRAYRMMDYSAR